MGNPAHMCGRIEDEPTRGISRTRSTSQVCGCVHECVGGQQMRSKPQPGSNRLTNRSERRLQQRALMEAEKRAVGMLHEIQMKFVLNFRR
eukprot:360433-Chlamydomonas_euryale.AAC.18